jgi:hypothetical protein
MRLSVGTASHIAIRNGLKKTGTNLIYRVIQEDMVNAIFAFGTSLYAATT